MTDAEIVGIALNDGLEHHGHEFDDVTGRVHALTPQAKKYEEAGVALDRLLRRIDELTECLIEATFPMPWAKQEDVDRVHAALGEDADRCLGGARARPLTDAEMIHTGRLIP